MKCLIAHALLVAANAVAVCPPIPTGEYRGTLSPKASLVIRVSTPGELQMKIEDGGDQVDAAIVWYEFDADCGLTVTDKRSRDGFADLRTRMYYLSRRLVVEDIQFESAEFVVGGWLKAHKSREGAWH